MNIPILLQPGGLRTLNQSAFNSLKAPIFLMSPEPSRPSSASSGVARLYEIVTGLYIVYHDYGDQLLTVFLKYCDSTFPFLKTDIHKARIHIGRVTTLRIGFCHGLIENCSDANAYVSRIKEYLNEPSNSGNWPTYPASLTDAKCASFADALALESNKFRDVLVRCIQACSANALPYRQCLEQKVFNGAIQQYGNGAYYFNMRVVDMLLPQKGSLSTPIQSALQNWLNNMKSDLIDGQLSNEDEPMRRLMSELYSAVGFTPSASRPSATILGGLV